MERLATRTYNTNWPQAGLHEYLLVAQPDRAITEKIQLEKDSLTSMYAGKATPKRDSYIKIASFMAREAMEETIIRYTQRVCSQQASFKVELNNYSGFPPHSIYLRVQNPQPFRALVSELKVVSNYVSSCDCPRVNLVTNPHLTIAGKLPETSYLQAMMEYSQRSFYETFMVNELVLLRRSSAYDECKKLHVFHLQPEGFKPYPNELFN